MTLKKIRAGLPTHIPLTPDKVIQNGDLELVFTHNGPDHGEWRVIDPASRIGTHWQTGKPYKVKDFYAHFARPIPPHILDNQAFWIWLGKDFDKFPSREQLTEAGGPEKWSAYFEAGRLYDKWLLEQMEDV